MKTFFVFICLGVLPVLSRAQDKGYEIDLRHVVPKPAPAVLPMSGTSPGGERLSVNSQYFEKDGRPWFPLMGEMHYNRVRPEDWEREIRKMKQAGLSIVATYVFWNEHERRPGVWDWEGNRDLRRFIELCERSGMYVWLRIGPWSHGEQLYGGFPSWIEAMKGRRTNDPAYLEQVGKLFRQIGGQTGGLFFEQGGPIIGVQLENEYAAGQPGHISTLKRMALEAGIHPVYWSVTANTVFDDSLAEVIPLQGSYPYRGWEPNGGKATTDFLYGDDQWIMTDALGKVFYNVDKYPKGLCEQGCGSQMTYANRFVVEPYVVEAHLQNQVGRGMNMVGYYMFRGGTQTPGLKEPGLPESYDFQAPIGEYGYIRPSYRYLKTLHLFLNDFGSELAGMQVVEPAHPVRDPLDTSSLRYIVREKEGSGYLFLCNAQVRVHMPDKRVRISLQLPDGRITFPPLLLKGQTSPILPFNLRLDGVTLHYVTAQVLARSEDDGIQTVFFQRLPGVDPQVAVGDSIIRVGGRRAVSLKGADGKKLELVFLSREEALNAWKVDGELAITDGDLIQWGDSLEVSRWGTPVVSLSVYDPLAMKFIKNTHAQPARATGVVIRRAADTNEVIVALPQSLPAGVGDVMVRVSYRGSICRAMMGDSVVADDLSNGMPWLLGLHKFLGKGTLRLVADPGKGGRIEDIRVVPQYRHSFFRKAPSVSAIDYDRKGSVANARQTKFNYRWQLLVLDSNVAGKADATVTRDQSFKSQFDEQYIKDVKDGPELILKKEIQEAVKGFSGEYPLIKNKKWKNVSLPSPVRYEQQLNPGPKSFQGICYYRKNFRIPQNLQSKELSLLFEGAMQTATVWINGKYIMQHRGGYTPFVIPLDNIIHKNAQNEIIIRLDNRDDIFTPPGKPLNRNGFLYWSGIYRDAWLIATPAVHITNPVAANIAAGGGVFIRTENISGKSADVIVKTNIKNSGALRAKTVNVSQVIRNKTGKIVAELKTSSFQLHAGADTTLEDQVTIDLPQLWSPDAPNLYTLTTTIRQGNTTMDEQTEKFGIRHLYFSRSEGFKLNGKQTRISGTNLHQDYPFIGNAVSNRAHLRDLIKIKNAGFNFVRLPHYPHDPSVYAYCDSLGLMVADCIPGWQFYNHNNLFEERVYKDIRDMVRRDRNHPSVILWEVSLNESLPPADFRAACVQVAKAEYPGNQFFTSGDTQGGKENTWDVAYNGWKEPFGRPQEVQPNSPGFVREYGDYEFGGSHSTTRTHRGHGQQSLLQSAWNLQWEHNLMRSPQYYPWTVGDANWAFYDGGEGWTNLTSDWGIADIYHIPKFSYYFYQSQRPAANGPMVYIADWWARRNKPSQVIVYSNCDSITLFLNDELLASQTPDSGPDTDYGSFTKGGNAFDGGNARNLDHPPFTFNNITWQPGVLKAIGFIKGKKVAENAVQTPKTAEAVKLEADTQGVPLVADDADAVFVHAVITDGNGTVVTPDDDTEVSFSVEGPGQIVSPARVKARAGIASVLIKSSKKAGTIKIKAVAGQLPAAVLSLKTIR